MKVDGTGWRTGEEECNSTAEYWGTFRPVPCDVLGGDGRLLDMCGALGSQDCMRPALVDICGALGSQDCMRPALVVICGALGSQDCMRPALVDI